ncbi:DUF2004 domain-containing protein [Cuniculiplasma sp. SKW4]|uniref:DUF2004 domain-containing protein n=1 Tax=Cuniculiplasma sp. SKW4 TaxID=3400171 RepID=UPI003FD5CE5F
MEKGVEISFQLNDKENDTRLVEALGNLTGNYFYSKFNLHWRIFRVTLEEKIFYKVLFTGKKINRLHPKNEEEIREEFDKLSHMDYNSLMNMYEEESKKEEFVTIRIQNLKEEYDLWQDKLWNYI